jgi:hypothetical protein
VWAGYTLQSFFAYGAKSISAAIPNAYKFVHKTFFAAVWFSTNGNQNKPKQYG